MKKRAYVCPEVESINIETKDIMSDSQTWSGIQPGTPVYPEQQDE